MANRREALTERVIGRVLGSRFAVPDPLRPLIPARVTIRQGRLVPLIGGFLAGMRGPAAAVAMGRTIIVHSDVTLTRRLLLHELEHVRQWREERLFPVRYTLETLRRGYRNNRYEREARGAEASDQVTRAARTP